jgi:hypothetical protein
VAINRTANMFYLNPGVVLRTVFRDIQFYNIMTLINAEPVHVDFRTRATLIAHKHVILVFETHENQVRGINYLQSHDE